jgi:predicted RNA binding protein YcfA (HicA-like mRNA interferase family)
MYPKEIIKILEERGFVLKRINGSHHVFQHPLTKKITVLPLHKKDLPKGTLNAIFEQSGIDKKTL